MVVEIRPEDVPMVADGADCGNDQLSVMRLQQMLERSTWQQGNRKQTAPAQRMCDFVDGRLSYDLPKSSYSPGMIASPLHFWMPKFISKRLQEGFKTFGRQAHGFLTNEAVMIAMDQCVFCATMSPCSTSVWPGFSPAEKVPDMQAV